jgi:hypothetical protein
MFVVLATPAAAPTGAPALSVFRGSFATSVAAAQFADIMGRRGIRQCYYVMPADDVRRAASANDGAVAILIHESGGEFHWSAERRDGGVDAYGTDFHPDAWSAWEDVTTHYYELRRDAFTFAGERRRLLGAIVSARRALATSTDADWSAGLRDEIHATRLQLAALRAERLPDGLPAAPRPLTVLHRFRGAFPAYVFQDDELRDALESMPLDSACGKDCADAIASGALFAASLAAAWGAGYPGRVSAGDIAETAAEACGTFITG